MAAGCVIAAQTPCKEFVKALQGFGAVFCKRLGGICNTLHDVMSHVQLTCCSERLAVFRTVASMTGDFRDVGRGSGYLKGIVRPVTWLTHVSGDAAISPLPAF